MALWDPGQRTIFFDVMLMTYEVMESRLRSNILELIRKLYIKEVYDHWVLHIFVLLSPSCGLTFFCVGCLTNSCYLNIRPKRRTGISCSKIPGKYGIDFHRERTG